MRGPQTLFGRVALVVGGGLVLAHALTLAIVLRERAEAGRSMMGAYVGRDVAAAVAVLDAQAPGARAAWLPRLARPNYRYALEGAPPLPPAADDLALDLRTSIAAALGPARVGVMASDGAMRRVLALALADGAPLTLRFDVPPPRISATTLVLVALQLATLGLAAWFGVRLAVRPLAAMAEAAARPAAAPFDEGGPREVAQAARALNAMQRRIAAQLAERMQLLAAISHDLQTPITRLVLRCEQVSDSALRTRMRADLAAMQRLVEEGLAYAKSAHSAQEPAQPVDIDALLDGLVADAADAGHDVALEGRAGAPWRTRVQALTRVVGNLLDNAVKFGGAAHVVVQAEGDTLVICVRDRGPGIPAAQLQAVLLPYYRVEGSRSRDTGGTGLGLAIAHELCRHALGGRLELANRVDSGGGLEARVVLPRLPPAAAAL